MLESYGVLTDRSMAFHEIFLIYYCCICLAYNSNTRHYTYACIYVNIRIQYIRVTFTINMCVECVCFVCVYVMINM